jgi:hypothetical protein
LPVIKMSSEMNEMSIEYVRQLGTEELCKWLRTQLDEEDWVEAEIQGIASHRLGATVSPPTSKMVIEETLQPPTTMTMSPQCHPQY